MEPNGCFSFSVHDSGRKSTRYFNTLVKVSNLLLLLDRYLLSIFKLKQNISHLLLNESFADQIIIQEETAYDGEAGAILHRYLKSGKELVLSSLQHIETTADLDELLKKLSALVYETQEGLRPHNFLDVLTHSRLDRIAFARQLYPFWLYFANSGSTTPIKLESVGGSPRIAFTRKPPLREWLPQIKESSQRGKLILRHIDFGDSKRWRAMLPNHLSDRPMMVEIDDPLFLEGLNSTEQNEVNGILNGDILLAHYTTIYDPLLNKTTVKINKVHKHVRQSQATQLELFVDNAPTSSETDPDPGPEKPGKTKRKHKSWR